MTEQDKLDFIELGATHLSETPMEYIPLRKNGEQWECFVCWAKGWMPYDLEDGEELMEL